MHPDPISLVPPNPSKFKTWLRLHSKVWILVASAVTIVDNLVILLETVRSQVNVRKNWPQCKMQYQNSKAVKRFQKTDD